MRTGVLVLVVALSVIGCLFLLHSKMEEDNKTIVLPQNSNDSLEIRKIIKTKDSILASVENFDFIIEEQVAGDCFGTDTLYFDQSRDLVINKSFFGCGNEEGTYTTVYFKGSFVFHEIIESGEGLPISKSTIFYEKGKPIKGKRTDYKINWEKLVLIDSTFTDITRQQMMNLTQMSNISDLSLQDLPVKMRELVPYDTINNKIKFIDPNQQPDELHNYLIDSIYYKILKTDS